MDLAKFLEEVVSRAQIHGQEEIKESIQIGEEVETKDQTGFNQLCSMLSLPVSTPDISAHISSLFYNSIALRDLWWMRKWLSTTKAAAYPKGTQPCFVPGLLQNVNPSHLLFSNPAFFAASSHFGQTPRNNAERFVADSFSRKRYAAEEEPVNCSIKRKKRIHLPPTGLDPVTYKQKAQMRCLCVYRKARPTNLPYMSLDELGWSVDKLKKDQALLLFVNKWVKFPEWITTTLRDVVIEVDGTHRIAYKEESGRINWIGHVPFGGVIALGVKASLSLDRLLPTMLAVTLILGSYLVITAHAFDTISMGPSPSDGGQTQQSQISPSTTSQLSRKLVRCLRYEMDGNTTSTVNDGFIQCPQGCVLTFYDYQPTRSSECPFTDREFEKDGHPYCVQRPDRYFHEANFTCYCSFDLCNHETILKPFFPPKATVTISPFFTLFAFSLFWLIPPSF